MPKDDDINYDENLIDAVTNLNTFVDEENEDTDEIVDISPPGNIDELNTFDHLHLPHQDSLRLHHKLENCSDICLIEK